MIIIKDLCKSYDHNFVHQHLNMTIEENTITSILGPSGCGKTTLLRILAGLEGYEEGEIIGLQNKRIAYVFQEDRLLPWLSAEQNIAYVLKSHYNKEQIEERINRVFSLLQLEEYKAYPVNKLSGGMRRRVALGRGLAYDSDILLLDEPFKGLDRELRETLYDRIKGFIKEKPRTVICVTHDEDEAIKLGRSFYLRRIE